MNNEEVLKAVEMAVKITRHLQAWIDSTDGLDAVPIANCRFMAWNSTYQALGISIFIGEVEIYNSENNYPAELTFAFCRDAYKKEIRNLLSFLE
jgi:hypothetical protein